MLGVGVGVGAGVEVEVEVDVGAGVGAGFGTEVLVLTPQQHALPHRTSAMGVRDVSRHRSPPIRRAKRVPTCAPSPDRRRVSLAPSPAAFLVASLLHLGGTVADGRAS